MDNIELVLIALRRVIRAADLHSRQLIKTTGLTTPQLLLMQAVEQHRTAGVGELAAGINLSQATVTNILGRLEKRQLLTRQRSAVDKRKVQISLTGQGREAIRDAPVPLQESFIRQFNTLKSWEQEMLISALQRIAEMMDAEDLSASPVLDVGDLDRSSPAGT